MRDPVVVFFIYKDCEAIVQNNIIDNNLSSAENLAMGGGICCYHNDDTNAQPIIRNNIIFNNSALEDIDGGGGGICVYFSSPVIENNLIFDNYTDWYGGGIHCLHGGSPIIRNNVIHSNITTYSSPAGGGVSIVGASPILMNNIVTFNNDYGVCYIYGSVDIQYSDVWGNIDGNYYNCSGGIECFSIDPAFVDMYNNNFHLSIFSPCIDAGIPDTSGLNLPPFDLEGNPRIVDGNGDGYAIIDMGCYEFNEYIQNISLEIAELNALPGDTVLVPIQVAFPDDPTFTSAEIEVSGYSGLMQFVELIADSSLVGNADWMYESNEVGDINTIWMAGSEPISGEGVLIWMKFIVPDTAEDYIPITLLDAIFDTGLVPVSLNSGGVNIVIPIYGDVDFNEIVQAYDASMILQYLAGSITLDDLQLMVADVSLDETVSALDATLILQYGVGIIDSLPYQPGPVYVATGDIYMDDAVYEDEPIELPIYVTNSEKIYSFEGVISYDPQVLTLVGISYPTSSDGYTISSEVDEGKCRIIGSNIESYNQDWIFAKLRFKANDGFASCDSTFVSFDKLRWNENDVMYNLDSVKISKNLGVINPQEQQFILHQNSPNPFTQTTKIQFSIPSESSVSLKIYNIKGELVTGLVDEWKSKGTYEVSWNGKDRYGSKAVSGVYFYKFVCGNKEEIKRMILLN